MVGIVLVSHSSKLAEGVKEIAIQMTPDIKIETAGGTCDGRLGTDMNKISTAINNVYSEDGVAVFFDLGSALMNTEMAIEFLDDDIKKNIHIIDAPIVEGAVVGAVNASMNKSIDEIISALKDIRINKIQ